MRRIYAARRNPRLSTALLQDPAGADVGRRVPAGHARDLHDVAGVRRVDELAAADVDADVAETVEEDEVAGLELVAARPVRPAVLRVARSAATRRRPARTRTSRGPSSRSRRATAPPQTYGRAEVLHRDADDAAVARRAARRGVRLAAPAPRAARARRIRRLRSSLRRSVGRRCCARPLRPAAPSPAARAWPGARPRPLLAAAGSPPAPTSCRFARRAATRSTPSEPRAATTWACSSCAFASWRFARTSRLNCLTSRTIRESCSLTRLTVSMRSSRSSRLDAPSSTSIVHSSRSTCTCSTAAARARPAPA